MRPRIAMWVLIGALAVAAFTLSGCGDQVQPTRQPVPVSEREPEQPKKKDTSGGLCFPCIGPHLNLNNGNIEMFSTGPGISFY
jgi:hypothetical protein